MATLHQQQPAGLEPVGAELGQVERIGAELGQVEQVEGGARRAGGPKAEQLERSGAKWNKSKPNRKRSKAGPTAEQVEGGAERAGGPKVEQLERIGAGQSAGAGAGRQAGQLGRSRSAWAMFLVSPG